MWFGNMCANGAVVSDGMLQVKGCCLGNILGTLVSAHLFRCLLDCFVYKAFVSFKNVNVFCFI